MGQTAMTDERLPYEDFPKKEPFYGLIEGGKQCEATYRASKRDSYRCRRLKGRHKVHAAIWFGKYRGTPGAAGWNGAPTGPVVWTE